MLAHPTGASNGNSGAPAPEFPVLRISNRHASAVVCLPDGASGYYRSTRFDWAGVVRDLRCRGRRYVGEWFTRHDPLCHDGITGPVDEFTQIGYERTRPGGEFLKIGVGMLRKPSDEGYDRFRLYEVTNPGQRELLPERDRVEFRHQLLSDDYGYDYRKTLRLTDGPGLRIEYTLKNLGPALLAGYVYNHNFFTLDRMAVGPDTEIRFPFRPAGTWREAYDSVALTDDGIAFRRPLQAGETVFMGDLYDPAGGGEGYAFRLRNLRTGTGIAAQGSGRLSHMVLWASPRVACLEPYTPFRVYPGETGVWHIEYELLG